MRATQGTWAGLPGSTALTAPVVFGCAGPVLAPREHDFFQSADPVGFILFARNCQDPDQVRSLVEELRGAVGRADALILIDQEGGRVARLGPPHWRAAPAAAKFGALGSGEEARRAVWLNARLLAAELSALGISVNCAPVLDLPVPGAHEIIGDRAFGSGPDQVAALGRSFCDGLLAGGVLPVIKHMPGHGRATVDSHAALFTVTASRAELEATDFEPFRALAGMPLAMTAHGLFEALDPAAPASASAAVIADVIRGYIGFKGLLLSDDIAMEALTGSPGERAIAVLDAGCDIVLDCAGEMNQMEAVAAKLPAMGNQAEERAAAALAMLQAPAEFDREAAEAELTNLMAAS